MKGRPRKKKLVLIRSICRKELLASGRVEFLIEGLDLPFKFKIWNKSPSYMCFPVGKDSTVLSRLKVGDVLNMRYYSSDSSRQPEFLKTAVRHITRSDEGQFKDYHMVKLEILESLDLARIHEGDGQPSLHLEAPHHQT